MGSLRLTLVCPVVALIAMAVSQIPASGQSPGSRRPGSPPPVSYQRWLQEQPPIEPLEAGVVYTSGATPELPAVTAAEPAPSATTRNYLVLVNASLYAASEAIRTALETYVHDVELEGLTVELITVSYSSVESLRDLIKSKYSTLPNLEGMVLVGNLPDLWYSEPSEPDWWSFPCDMYLTDLDGLWIDTDGDAIVDQHTAGSGDEGPEIYHGRITAHNLTLEPGQDEVSLLTRYFNKVHDYRRGLMSSNGKGCLYIDDPWRWWTDQYATEMAQAWPDIDRFDDPYETVASDYLTKIQVPYEHLRVNVHYGAYGHGFGIPPEQHGGDVSAADLVAHPPQVLFYHLYCCTAGNWVSSNCIGLWYIMCGRGLGVFASSKSGGVNDATEFYGSIGQGDSFGYAVMHWFQSFEPYDDDERGWTLGMLWLGDPTLTRRSIMHGTLWCNGTTGEVDFLMADGRSAVDGGTVATLDPAAGWAVGGIGDFDGDNGDDVLWHSMTTGQVAAWMIRGLAIGKAGVITTVNPDSGWVIEGVGDFDGDGRSDVLWRNTTTGQVAAWLLRDLRIRRAGVVAAVDPASGWAIRAVGDFNGDGKADVLWRNTATGDVAIWRLDGITFKGGFLVRRVDPASGWTIQGAADFSGDGKCDILWRNVGTGGVAVWLMNGPCLVRGAVVATVDPAGGWTIQGTGDFDEDGRADIAWLNTSTGEFAVWRMRAASLLAGAVVHTIDPASSWSLEGIGNFR
ncbi:MAG: FG-GAP repeat protein [Verrucomicrobia bacterium]|nr:FG-GAP repeat protein [Verrucomicrobiota bacterium]